MNAHADGGYLRMDDITARAAEALPGFREIIADLSAEARGIPFHEMLFLRAAVGGRRPRRIVESGRARAQSTVILARCFPDVRIISIDYDADSDDARFAEERLKPYGNVCPLYGDARVLLPALVRPGDIVLIDGPKRFRALRLAFRVLAAARPAMVFLHDMKQPLPERRFLDRVLPEAVFSDDPGFRSRFSDLDADHAPESGEFPTLGCVPWTPGRRYRLLIAASILPGALARFQRRIEKRYGRAG